MPLNSEYLPKDVRSFLHELPLDKECCKDIYYQTKVEIFERECKDCGFVRIILSTFGDDGRQKVTVLNGVGAVEGANYLLNNYRCDVIRTCTYPQDITIKNDKEELPTLSEIVSNTCQFWHIEKLNIPLDEETAFIEAEELQIKVEKLVDKRTADFHRGKNIPNLTYMRELMS